MDGSSEKKWQCELDDTDFATSSKRFVDIKGLGQEDFKGVRSGYNTLYVEGGDIAGGALVAPSGANKVIARIMPRKSAARINKEILAISAVNEHSTIKTKDLYVLAVRVAAKDKTTTSSPAQIRNAIFGTSGDINNLKERFAACSYGEVIVNPFNGTTATRQNVTDGLIQVNLLTNVRGARDQDIMNQVELQLRRLVGDLPSQFDHVMLCLPPGTLGTWISYCKEHIVCFVMETSAITSLTNFCFSILGSLVICI